MRPEHRERLARAVVFAGLGGLGAWHVSRLQEPALAAGELVLPVLLALALAGLALRSNRALGVGIVLWIVAAGALVGDRRPSRAQPLAPFSTAFDQLRQGGARFASVVLPVDPTAEPGVHGLLLGAVTLWLAALALVWLVWRRPLATVVLAVLPVAIASSEFALPRPGLRVALFVALAIPALASGRRAGAPAIAALAAPLVLVALVAGSVPGVARAALVDWRAWGGSSGGTASDASDVRYAWDQSYDGLHYTGDPTVVLHVRSPRPSYWRVTVLDSFDGLRFDERSPGATTALPGADARVEPVPAGKTTNVQVEVDALDEPYLVGAGVPVAYDVPAATGGGTIDANGVLRVLRPPTRGTRYEMTAVIAEPTAAQLRAGTAAPLGPTADAVDATPFAGSAPLPAFGVAGRERAVQTALTGRPAWQRAYAWAVRATAGAHSPYDVALALERGLRATHGYDGSSTLPANDPNALAHWIVGSDAGYCQMFSASMTELLRLLGVPARIAEGFDTGVYDPSSKSYVIDDRDAHAWVEAWLPGAGYVPFDPTPGHTLPDQASLSPVTTTKAHHAPTTPRPKHAPAPVHAGPSVTARSSDLTGRGHLLWLSLVAVLLVLAAAAVAVVRRRRSQGTRADPREAAAASRTRLRAAARRAGAELSATAANGELADALEGQLGVLAGGWADAADRAAYAPIDQAIAALPALRSETERLAAELRSRGRVTIPA